MIGIIGAGLAGLTIVHSLNKPFEIIEREKSYNGLCSSIIDSGFTFDHGGHIIFSKNEKVLSFMLNLLGNNVNKKRRNTKIFFKDNLVKYPFENDLASLPKEDNFECLYHYIYNNYPKPTNFREWIYYTFGKGIAEKYLVPYNEKIWNTKTELMSMEWVADRVPKPPAEDVIKSALGISTEGYTHQLYFYYPSRGGIQALITALENKVKNNIIYNFNIKKIKKENNQFIISNGVTEKKFDKLVSTMPLPKLISVIDGVPEEVVNAANNLKYNSLVVVCVGVDINNLNDVSWMYFPDKETLFHRIVFQKNFSEHTVPEGKSSVMAELTFIEGDNVSKLSDEEIINRVIEELHNKKIIDESKVCYKNIMRTKYAYVIFDLDYHKNMRIIKDYINKLGIILCGRFGEFEYLNMDAVVERALVVAEKLDKENF